MTNTALYEDDVLTKRHFHSSKLVDSIPEGYLTSDKFWSLVEKDTEDFCKEYGIL